MTDKEKFEKLKKLADAMYYAAKYLTTDASRLHKAMDEYHKFIIHEYKEEPVSEGLDSFAIKYAQDKPYPVTVCQAVKVGANWQEEQLLAKAVDVTIAIPYQNGDGGYSQIVDSKEALPFGEKVKVIVIKED